MAVAIIILWMKNGGGRRRVIWDWRGMGVEDIVLVESMRGRDMGTHCNEAVADKKVYKEGLQGM